MLHTAHWYQFISLVSTEEPATDVIYNQFQVPLPKVVLRDVVAMKYWISEYMTEDGTQGATASQLHHASFVAGLVAMYNLLSLKELHIYKGSPL